MKRLFLLLILLCNVPLLFAETASESLAKQLKSVCTFSSDFTQEVLGDQDVIVQRSVGKMQFDRCQHQALFYWQVVSPNPSTMYFRESKIIIFDPELNQATIKKVSYKDPNMLPLMLLTGDSTKVLTHFLVISKDNHHFMLQPKSKDKDAILLGVMLDLTSEGAIQKIQYQTVLGPKTQINFGHVQMNQSLQRALFFESIPKGADIVSVE